MRASLPDVRDELVVHSMLYGVLSCSSRQKGYPVARRLACTIVDVQYCKCWLDVDWRVTLGSWNSTQGVEHGGPYGTRGSRHTRERPPLPLEGKRDRSTLHLRRPARSIEVTASEMTGLSLTIVSAEVART